SPSGLRVILAPSLAGIVVAILVLHAFPTVRGSGVNQTKAALYIYNGYIPLRTGVGKFITSAWAIGAGHSLGPEDPSLQIGASVVVMRWFLGSEPMFRIPAVQLIRPQELLAYAALGIVGGFAAVIFARGIGFLRPRLKVLPRWTQYLQPGIAGLMIGLIGYVGFPQVMGAGYEYIDEAMHGQFTWKTLAMLAALKILATTLSFVSGTPGGMFAPTLFIGAMLG